MKNLFILVSMIFFFSCERNQISDENIISNNPSSRSATILNQNPIDFDPIEELEGIEVNLINIGSGSNKYLSCDDEGNVNLSESDNGSKKQRWYINGSINNDGYIKSAAYVGRPIYTDSRHYYTSYGNWYISPFGVRNTDIPTLSDTISCGTLLLIGNDLVIRKYKYFRVPIRSIVTKSSSGRTSEDTCKTEFRAIYLQRESDNSSKLAYKLDSTQTSTHWIIEPAGDYVFDKIEYIKGEEDYTKLEDSAVRTYYYENESSNTEATATIQLSENIKYSSSFTEGKTVSVSNKITAGIKIGIPKIGFDSNISYETSTSNQWNYSTTETQERQTTVTDTYNYKIPANINTKLEVHIASYKMRLTYIMTLRRIGDNKRFRIKGKWSGVQGTVFTYKKFNSKNGEFLSENSINK